MAIGSTAMRGAKVSGRSAQRASRGRTAVPAIRCEKVGGVPVSPCGVRTRG